jgi:thioesterase domain-containing protein
MDLLATLNRTFGVRVTPSQFNAAPTIAGLANCISVAGLPDGNARAANGPHPQLIVVRDGNDEPPLVCLHPAGGAVTAYMTLRTALSGNRPILAIQSRATADAGAEFGTIDEMARCYSELLLGVRGGTVSLFGWSLGGVLAHAVGAVLEDRGLRVEQVGMVDPPEPGAAISRRIDDLAVTAIVYDNTPNPPAPEVWAEAVQTIVASGRPERMLAECEARGFLPAGLLSSTEFQNARALYTAHAQSIVGYVPQRTILAPVSIWWAVSRPGSRWARCTAGRFKDRVVGGSHYTIMKPPFLQSILSEFESQRDLFSRLCVEKGTN